MNPFVIKMLSDFKKKGKMKSIGANKALHRTAGAAVGGVGGVIAGMTNPFKATVVKDRMKTHQWDVYRRRSDQVVQTSDRLRVSPGGDNDALRWVYRTSLQRFEVHWEPEELEPWSWCTRIPAPGPGSSASGKFKTRVRPEGAMPPREVLDWMVAQTGDDPELLILLGEITLPVRKL